MRRVFVILFIVCSWAAAAQHYPQGYFRSPLDTQLYLSANFGALRANHFHSGIDIKTFGKEGFPVIAVADGYVVRIKVSPFGYGKALYINHPNGYTSVYGHLQRFCGEIEEYATDEQYRRKSFDVEIFPSAHQLKVKKGDTIAISGNSGGSTGPHLHFEIRDTKSEATINPLLFDFPIGDSIAPEIANYFLLYVMDDEYKHQTGAYPSTDIKRNNVKKPKDTLFVQPGVYGFGMNATDRLNEVLSDVGINYLKAIVDGDTLYNQRLERFFFDESRMVNDCIDYPYYMSHSQRMIKCFVDDGNKLHFYDHKKRVKIHVAQGQHRNVQLVASDLAGRADTLTFTLSGDSLKGISINYKVRSLKAAQYAYPGKNNFVTRDNYKITIPDGALYDTILMSTSATHLKKKGIYSDLVTVLNNKIPLHESVTVAIKPKIPAGEKINYSKLLIVRWGGKGNRTRISEGGEYNDGWVTAKTKTFGTYSIAVDTEAPVVSRFKINGSQQISVQVTDNLAGIDTYNAYIDGQWLLMEYDAKDDMLYSKAREPLAAGKHEFKLVVTDNKKNTRVFTQTIDIK